MANIRRLQPIIIGGAGRSGTTIIKNTLANHPDVIHCGGELRWLCDPDGLCSLFRAVTDGSPWEFDLATKRFVKLLRDEMPSKFRGCFGNNAHNILEDFLESITDMMIHTKYHGSYGGSVRFTARTSQNSFDEQFRFFIDRLMHERQWTSESPTHWIDDTPDNCWQWRTFRRIWPDAVMIQAVRFPLDTVASIMARQRGREERQIWWWPEPDIEKVAQFVSLADWQETLPYVKRQPLEELVDLPNLTTAELCAICNLLFDSDLINDMRRYIDRRQHRRNRWREELTPEEIQTAASFFWPGHPYPAPEDLPNANNPA